MGRSSLVADLRKYRVPPEDLECVEYAFRLELVLKEGIQKQGKVAKARYETSADLCKIVSALLNTSGGIIYLCPRIPQKQLGDKDFDEWLNRFRDTLKFVTDAVYQQCITTKISDGAVEMNVLKSPEFITTQSYLHTRGPAGNIKVKDFDFLRKIVNICPNKFVENKVGLPNKIEYGTTCKFKESSCLEFKHFSSTSPADLLMKLKQERPLKALLGMANLQGGGDVVIGVKEDDNTKSNIFLGQELERSDENAFKSGFLQILVENDDGLKRIWGDPTIVPTEGVHFDCRFQEVHNTPPLSKRKVVIQIHMYHTPKGVIELTPESYVVNDDGFIEELDFESWSDIHKPTMDTIGTQANTPASLTTNVNTSGGNVAGMGHLKPEQLEGSTLKKGSKITYRSHSSTWIPGTTQDIPKVESDTSELFETGLPVKYTPSRDIIEKQIGNHSLLSNIDREVGLPSFGIAAENLLTCFVDSSAYASLTRPPEHVMDFLVISEAATIFIFVLCVTFSQEKQQKSYAIEVTRRIKKILLANATGIAMATMNIQTSVINLRSDQLVCSTSSPLQPARFNWLCKTIRHSLLNVETFFAGVLKQEACLKFSQHQMEALVGTDLNRFNFVEGPPGCGKTLLAQYLCETNKREHSAYISASKPLTNHVNLLGKAQAFYAENSQAIPALLEHLTNRKHIVIDDCHNFDFHEESWHKICCLIIQSDMHLYIFQDSSYHNFKRDQSSMTIEQFLFENRSIYGPVLFKTMNIIRRNSQVVGSYIRALAKDVTHHPVMPGHHHSSLQTESPLEGDDIIIHHVPKLRVWNESNGVLLYAQKLINLGQVKPIINRYFQTDVAILMDHPNRETLSREITSMNDVFKRKWPESRPQSADVFPVTGVRIDSLDNFSGLEARCVIFILPENTRNVHQRSLQNPCYKIAVASRGVDRVDFLSENLVLEDAKHLKCDLLPSNLLTQVTPKEPSQPEPPEDSLLHPVVPQPVATEADGVLQLSRVAQVSCPGAFRDVTPAGTLLIQTRDGFLRHHYTSPPGPELKFKLPPKVNITSAIVNEHTGDIVLSGVSETQHTLLVRYTSSVETWSVPFDIGLDGGTCCAWCSETDVIVRSKNDIKCYNVIKKEQLWGVHFRFLWARGTTAGYHNGCFYVCNDTEVTIVSRPERTAKTFHLKVPNRRFCPPVHACVTGDGRLVAIHREDVGLEYRNVISVWTLDGTYVRDQPVNCSGSDTVFVRDTMLFTVHNKMVSIFDLSQIVQ